MNATQSEQDIKALYNTASSAGLWIVPRDKCCKLLAVMLVFGGGNEAFVMNPTLREACFFAQRMFHIQGGEVPDAEATIEIQRLVAECGGERNVGGHQPDWAVAIAKEYKFKLNGG